MSSDLPSPASAATPAAALKRTIDRRSNAQALRLLWPTRLGCVELRLRTAKARDDPTLYALYGLACALLAATLVAGLALRLRPLTSPKQAGINNPRVSSGL